MKQTIQTLKEALSPHYETREVKAITRLLLEEVCGLTYTQIVMQADDPLPDDQRKKLADMATLLAQGIPVQQVLGYTWFCGRKFGVSSDVLIPRPETEELVNMIVENFVQKSVDNPEITDSRSVETSSDNAVYNLVDIGTGSGCIALSLAQDIKGAFVTAVDLSTGALTIAESNAKSLGINNVKFVQTDILKEETEDFSTELSTGLYDAIVSNPPYICQSEAQEMESHVLDHEPHLALFVPDQDPLLFYRAIAKFALRHLKQNGGLYFEINAAYGSETSQLLRELGYHNVTLHQDFTGRDRFVLATIN